MYKLNSAPIFLEFLDMFLKKANSKIKIKRTNRLFLHDKCVCGKDGCNSFILKTKQKIPEGQYCYHTIKTNKGTFGIELCDDSTFLFVATENKNFPFKKEFENMFINHKATVKNRILPFRQAKLTKKDKQKLHQFFWDFEIEEFFKFDESIDDMIAEYI